MSAHSAAMSGGPTIFRPGHDPGHERPEPIYRSIQLEADPLHPAGPAPGASLLSRVNRRRGAILTTLVSVAAIASFGGVVYWAHQSDVQAGGKGLEPIVIKADDRPTKVKPDNAGGMQVQNQGIEAYNRVAPGAVPSQPEKLLPPPPTPKPPTVAQLVTPPAPVAGTPGPTASPAGSLPQTVAPGPKPDSAKAEIAKPAEPPQVKDTGPSIGTLIDGLSGAAGGWRVQLAAVPNEEQAKSTWARLQQANGDVLGPLRMQAARIDRGEKSGWYRVQAGPLDERQAQKVCGTLKDRRVDCIPIQPARGG